MLPTQISLAVHVTVFSCLYVSVGLALYAFNVWLKKKTQGL